MCVHFSHRLWPIDTWLASVPRRLSASRTSLPGEYLGVFLVSRWGRPLPLARRSSIRRCDSKKLRLRKARLEEHEIIDHHFIKYYLTFDQFDSEDQIEVDFESHFFSVLKRSFEVIRIQLDALESCRKVMGIRGKQTFAHVQSGSSES